ncbi:MlaD family protein [Flavobacterium humi]|uniref:MCE family protein n=1 Tax=Flavobacterium humi TaxID=2562683 RepID=A0A4Z0LA02_9FLAO|nr:MlaD family protein [Flavobacterium humi]TGD59149.1 MCE family protein [Flavobacterium humi]
MNKNAGYIWKLGMFVVIGVVLFAVTVYFIGVNKNLFVPTFQLQSHFKNVSGLKIGSNVRFSGINVGTVKEIEFVSDTAVVVKLSVKKEVQQYIKTDAMASIGSDGLMGDKVLTISPGTDSQTIVKDNASIQSVTAVEMDDLMRSIKITVDNASVITEQLAQFSYKMNSKDGALSKLMDDKAFANRIDTTMKNIQKASKGLNENMEAAKHNFLLRGYFNKKKKAEEKKQKETKKAEEKKQEALTDEKAK